MPYSRVFSRNGVFTGGIYHRPAGGRARGSIIVRVVREVGDLGNVSTTIPIIGVIGGGPRF